MNNVFELQEPKAKAMGSNRQGITGNGCASHCGKKTGLYKLRYGEIVKSVANSQLAFLFFSILWAGLLR